MLCKKLFAAETCSASLGEIKCWDSAWQLSLDQCMSWPCLPFAMDADWQKSKALWHAMQASRRTL